MGDKRINSSIGSQWRYRIDIVDEQIKELAKKHDTRTTKKYLFECKINTLEEEFRWNNI